MAHIEVINPKEKIHPSLGGTGYQPPAQPSTVDELIADLNKANAATSLGVSVWKVKRESAIQPRRLTLPNGRYLKCRIIGGTGYESGYWWFACVSTADGLEALSSGSHPERKE